MSENYQYAECKHCGKSIMEGEIHSCRKMLLAEIEDLREALKQEEQHAFQWKQTALAQGEGLAQYIIAKDRYREALQKIEDCDECDPEISISLLQLIAREALADRP